jgi:hypothetical protein
VLITGENGLFMKFIHEIRNFTKNLVLFIDRVDKKSHSEILFKTNICGDESDLELDVELQKLQNIHLYFPYRLYFSTFEKMSPSKKYEEFWKLVDMRL